ncbi:hypothetical protein FRC06_007162 [Ceratobasidium sp. 370]|nr:hypothetical protein FRC06_007162 [Ceratobasidium sp. 370]
MSARSAPTSTRPARRLVVNEDATSSVRRGPASARPTPTPGQTPPMKTTDLPSGSATPTRPHHPPMSTFSSSIAKKTFQLQHGRSTAPTAGGFSGMLNAIATSAYRFILIFSSMFVSLVLSYVPVLGPTAAFIFVCWIDAFYCFEFTWIAKGMRLSECVRYEEERWAYFLAFGKSCLPSTAMCMSGSSLANAAVFALVYPAYIIMAMSAKPKPDNPYQPLPPSEHDTPDPVFPSPFVPIRIPFFAPVIWLNDQVANVLDFSTGGRRRRPSAATSVSVSGMEGVEEGVGYRSGPGRPGLRVRKDARKLD